ncbi:MAG: agmatinase [Vicinamibacterales bacterium]
MRRPRLVGLPYDASSSFLRGAAEAPPAIRAALHSPAGNSWTEDGIDLTGVLEDGVDLPLAPDASAREAIEIGIAAALLDRRVPIALGGDHSVTYPILRAVARVHGPVTILHVDAHPDLYADYEGDRYSHACPFARIMEERLATRLVQVGIRTMTGHQREQAERFGVEVVSMRQWLAGVRPAIEGRVYVSVDLDGLDPAFAPGVSHREPGGLSVRDVLGLIHAASGPLVGADVVELNPRRDVDGVTAAVAAKIVKELAGRVAAERHRQP